MQYYILIAALRRMFILLKRSMMTYRSRFPLSRSLGCLALRKDEQSSLPGQTREAGVTSILVKMKELSITPPWASLFLTEKIPIFSFQAAGHTFLPLLSVHLDPPVRATVIYHRRSSRTATG